MDESNRIAYWSLTGGKQQLRDPITVPRPGTTRQVRAPATPSQVKAFFSIGD